MRIPADWSADSVIQPHRLVLGLALLLLSALTAVGNGMVLHAIRQRRAL